MQVKLKNRMGSDLTVVNAARVSFDKESSWEDKNRLYAKDEKLIKYLADNNHWTPFGHPQLQLHVEAPIFVARQLGKHQVGLVWNEVSRRYVDAAPKFWFPSNLRNKSVDRKQGSSEDTNKSSAWWLSLMHGCASSAVGNYQQMIKEGVAPEQARMFLPQNMYTEWYWTGSLYAFSRICNLRCKEDTQLETRLIADQIKQILKEEFPVSAKYLLR